MVEQYRVQMPKCLTPHRVVLHNRRPARTGTAMSYTEIRVRGQATQ